MKYFIFSLLMAFLLFSCSDKNSLSEKENQYYSEKGIEIVQTCTKAIKSHLASAIRKGGVGYAIEYCNANAYRITDSLSKAYNATIRRTSMNFRNPKNAPDEYEKDVLQIFATAHHNKKPLQPLIRKVNDSTFIFFFPIFVDNPVCLNCHGDPDEVSVKELYGDIRALYPNDKATGYNVGDFRGLWSVRFVKKSNVRS
jgi:hypothetical protein